MSFKNSINTYGAIAKILHWAMALVIMGLIIVGLYMVTMPYSPDKIRVIGLHKSFGLLILMLVTVRLVWRFRSTQPAKISTHKKWERTLSNLAHIALYGFMIALPLTGWIMSSAAQYPIPFFGLNMPDIAPRNSILAGIANNLHSIFAFSLIGFIVLHAAGAFKHHFIDKDQTLSRMAGGTSRSKISMFLAILFAFFLCAVFYLKLILPVNIISETSPTVKIQNEQQIENTLKLTDIQWIVDEDLSQIGFSGTIYGASFQGQFTNYQSNIQFDPEALERSKVRVRIYMDKIETGDTERDEQLQTEEWFGAGQFSFAQFTSTAFEELEDGMYNVAGDLTIKETTQSITFPFQLNMTDASKGAQTAVMKAKFGLNRLEYGLGTTQWGSGETVDIIIPVTLDITAHRDF